jgi:periplasmic protein TonB
VPDKTRVSAAAALAALALVLAAGGAGAQAADAPRVPHRSVSIGEALDSAATAERLCGLVRPPVRDAAWVFIAWFSPRTGAVDSVKGVRRDALPPDAAEAVMAALMAGARRLPPSDSVAVLEVVAIPGDPPTLRAVRSEPPRLSNSREIARDLTRFTRTYARAKPRPPSGTRVVVVRMRVDDAGIPSRVFVPAPSSEAELNAQAVSAGSRMRFTPAMLEGEPVAVWIQLPLTFTIP